MGIVTILNLTGLPYARSSPLALPGLNSGYPVLPPQYHFEPGPILSRVLRNDLIETLQEDFILLAKAKGLSYGYILLRHALRPSSFTLITIVGIQLGNLISGAVIVESIFALPGIGP